ncbi:cation-translocating P-type ATPase [Acetobacterium woodii]|uniref:Calcium-translocating P-type ATPase n=1 Tax=Acetobacterium woodii (strain ATCC 29683 / DSM 1030 / JCM 2381 / KCTC 1655 / WB1) TaxID=931626 RepID=H6LBV4_ACEWD|nr:cation-translocating P-type ATPase [Acetobacterium woodii]AFA47697.1 calcium-translocating P-type ATPase [Acetobacterium woodii DSM 1030]
MTTKETMGLTTAEARKRQEQYGKNELTAEKKESFFFKTIHIICEPMFLLLIVAAVIYFVLGEPRDGAVMLIFVIGIISIDVIQEWKTDQTLNALKELSAPHVTVRRDGKEITIASVDLVPGDLMLIAEGVKIPADGEVIKANDLCVDESSLTGEAEGVWKVTVENAEAASDYWRRDYCYAGTLVTQGNATILVEKIGAATEYGKIGANVAAVVDSPTPLQKQTDSLVKLCAGIAAVLFLLVSTFTYFNVLNQPFNDRIIESILSGITLAMAMIPEEFPVILMVFLSMGAWRLAKNNSLVRKLPAVETLGAVSVLCVDKTGTITMNQMTVQETWAWQGDEENLCEIMGLGCETDAYDPMEKAMLRYCEEHGVKKTHLFGGDLITEYAFTNELKMMGHVWHHDGEIIVAAKGSPERLLTICDFGENERAAIEAKITEMSKQGLRVIAVGEMRPQTEAEIPTTITEAKLTFLGLIGLADPPRESVKDDIKNCLKAGVRVVMITGDNGITASSIAKQIGMPNSDHIITGDELSNMSDEVLREKVKDVSIFSRVIPEHKMRIVKAFKDNGEVVAMTGDGVNDAPALKSADIGIAMGKRGSEVSREAADLILMDDNFSTIIDTIKDGRRIYDNIRKAVGYVFTIHIPIAFSSLLAPLLGIAPASLFLLPLHVVLLELIIDPTCSIVLERQPAEHDIMERKPRDTQESILTATTLAKSVIQGLVIFASSFGLYYVFLRQGNPALARTMGLVVIMLANLVLVQVNSSNTDFAFQSFKRLIKDKVMWFINIGTIVGIIVILYTPINGFLKLYPLTVEQLLLAIGIAILSVIWYEFVKFINWQRNKSRHETTIKKPE